MQKRSLVIGMGIGQLYKKVLIEMGHEVSTVDSDPSKGAGYRNMSELRTWAPLRTAVDTRFTTAHICTPNFTHSLLAANVSSMTEILFIEKPGLRSAAEWQMLRDMYPFTNIMMVKNNMWRSNIAQMREFARNAKSVRINWINKARVPNPGSWFTDKKLAFGGVSRDLMPHLLSLFAAINNRMVPHGYRDATVTEKRASRVWNLSDLTGSDYGTVNQNGIYNVDDFCTIDLLLEKPWHLEANWQSNTEDKVNIEFDMGGWTETIELGLCPEEAYKEMIRHALECRSIPEFWYDQYKVDMWIHEMIEDL